VKSSEAFSAIFIEFRKKELRGFSLPPHGMSIASTIALSGLTAASLRLQVSASNVANANSDGPLPGSANAAGFPSAYSALQVDQVATSGGTTATVTSASPGTVPAYDPNAPYADGNGMVASPNVNIAGEIVQQLLARYSFAANAQVIRADTQMSAALLNVTA
jgi:flagellar basal-body rod protein FlgC